MVANSRPPPHAPPPHVPPPHVPPPNVPPPYVPPPNAAVAALEAQLHVAKLEAQLAAAKAALEAPQPPHPPNPPYAPNPPHAPNPPYPASALPPGVPAAGEQSVRAARKLSSKRPLAGGEGADARATKQHTVDLT